MTEQDGPDLAAEMAAGATVYHIDQVHPAAPRRSWVHAWRAGGMAAESPLLRVLRDGCGTVRLRWPWLT